MRPFTRCKEVSEYCLVKDVFFRSSPSHSLTEMESICVRSLHLWGCLSLLFTLFCHTKAVHIGDPLTASWEGVGMIKSKESLNNLFLATDIFGLHVFT